MNHLSFLNLHRGFSIRSGFIRSCVSRTLLLACTVSAPMYAMSLDDGLAAKKDKDFPRAEAAFSAVIVSEPKNAQAWAERATVRAWQDKYDAAIADWRQALVLSPTNADFHTGLARVLNWKGDRSAALSEIDRALLTKPRDPELWQLKGDIAHADHNRALALTAYREADRLDHGDRASRLGDDPWDPTRWRVDLNGVRDHYSNARGTESGFGLALGYHHPSEGDNDYEWFATGGLTQLNHFGAHDLTIGTEAGIRLYEPLLIRVDGTYTPDADFEPDWRVGGGIDLRIIGPVTALMDVRHSEYRDQQQQVLLAAPGLRIEPFNALTIEGRYLASTDHLSAQNGQQSTTVHSQAWQGRLTLNLGRLHPYIGYAQGEEPDPPAPTTYGRSVWGGLVFDLDRNLSIRADVAYEDRADWTRTSLGGGVILRF